MRRMATVALEARNTEANRLRQWQLELSRDLLGAWVLDVQFGRIGTRGRLQRHTFGDEPAALAFVRRALRRRATAQARIGVAYRAVHASTDMRVMLIQSGIQVM